MGTTTKGKIAKDDLKLWDGVNATFSRATSSGGTATYNVVDWVGVDVYQEFGARTRTAISNALSFVGTTNNVAFFLSPGTWTIDDNLTFASYSNVWLNIPPGAILNIAAGKTLTAYSPENLIVGPYTYTSGSGTLAFSNGGVQYMIGRVRWIDANDEVLHQFGDDTS